MNDQNKNQFSLSDRERNDVSKRAEAILDYVLEDEKKVEKSDSKEHVTVSEAMSATPILNATDTRSKLRTLIVTTDESVLVKNSNKQNEYLNLAERFDELHIFVLLARKGNDSFDRVSNNLWVYKIHHSYFWRLPKQAERSARQALVFNGAIRPDVVVGIDAFEAGLGAYLIAKSLERPVQLHLFKDWSDVTASKLSWWHRWTARYLLKRVMSVRTNTNKFLDKIKADYPKIIDTGVLPQFYNFSGLRQATPNFKLREKYPQYSFIMLTVAPLEADGHIHDVFTALRQLLLNKRIGLVVVGQGEAEKLFKEKVKLLGIEESVVFLRPVETDLMSCLKTADLLVMTGTDEASDQLLMQAVVAGSPLVAYENDLRRDLLIDGQSALLVKPKDIRSLTQKITLFINNLGLRLRIKTEVAVISDSRLYEDKDAYFESYQAIIESLLAPQDQVTANTDEGVAKNKDRFVGDTDESKLSELGLKTI